MVMQSSKITKVICSKQKMKKQKLKRLLFKKEKITDQSFLKKMKFSLEVSETEN